MKSQMWYASLPAASLPLHAILIITKRISIVIARRRRFLDEGRLVFDGAAFHLR